MKRALDLFGAAIGLVLLSPVLLIAAVLIKRADGGPVVYSGVRVGKDGRRFRMHKLRTMVQNADQIGGSCTAADDPRLTPIGAALRRYKIDEIPQLFNVLSGEMSLVGPRPEVPEYVDRYSAEERELLIVKPGITDWASIRFRDEEELYRGVADPEQIYEAYTRPEKVRLGREYVHHHSLRVDLWILFLTVLAVVRRPPNRHPMMTDPAPAVDLP